MCGIFAYLNYGVERDTNFLLKTLINGLRRLEYRGYDSAGMALDLTGPENPIVIKEIGTIDKLVSCVEKLRNSVPELETPHIFRNHVGIAHTRWATHGSQTIANCHPHSSDPNDTFLVVHNGIITNYKALKESLILKGCVFTSETDTEVVAKLLKYLYDKLTKGGKDELDFALLMMNVLHALEGAYALVVKSKVYPNEVVACKRGSPLVVGIKDSSFLHNYMNVRNASLDNLQKYDGAYLNLTSRELYVPSNEKSIKKRKIEEEGSIPRTNGVGSIQKEFFFSSDASAIVEHTGKVFYPEDNDIVHIQHGALDVIHFNADNNSQIAQSREISTLDLEIEQIMKGNYDHYMLKEIFEQPESLLQSMRGRIVCTGKDSTGEDMYEVKLGGIDSRFSDILQSSRIILIACGTSYNACVASRQIMEELTELPVSVELASDFLDRTCPIYRSDVCIFVSQSGETADVLEALRYSKKKKALCIGIVNVVGSAIARITDCGVHLNAGAEIGVASTKVYTSEIVVMTLIAIQLSKDSKSKEKRRQELLRALVGLPKKVEQMLKETNDKMKVLANRLGEDDSILLFGRGYQYATCLEGALKIKEITYMHTEGINAGELKHGPLALIDERMPVILFSSIDDHTSSKIHNALNQVMARGSVKRMTVVAPCEDQTMMSYAEEHQFELVQVPTTVDCLQSVLNIIPMQLLSYHVALVRKLDVDQPRNLAKCVTTE